MTVIRLSQGQWEYDPDRQLGDAGGFGAVYAGTREDYGEIAIKCLHISAQAAAHRELDIAADIAGRELRHVIPIYDAGEDSESGRYFIVMARAETSLDNLIHSRKRLPEDETISILLSIATGLKEVSHICHRDLKPANVLYHEGEWKLADFGIARFVEEATSSQTVKGFLSAPYAAPEQWQGKRATSATDVYALGCLAYECLAGEPPFNGPAQEAYQEQHLNQAAPRLEANSPALTSLISMMLRKIPDARPPIMRVIQLLAMATDGDNSTGRAAAALAEADAAITRAKADAEAQEAAESYQKKARLRLAGEGVEVLNELMQELLEKVSIGAPNARVESSKTQGLIQLGSGLLRWRVTHKVIDRTAFSHSGWNVAAGAVIEALQDNKNYLGPEGRSASLWYADLGDGDGFRWWEVPYMRQGTVVDHSHVKPFALEDIEEADEAASPITGYSRHAAQPKTIDAEDFESFRDRWLERLAEAAKCQLKRPSRLPED